MSAGREPADAFFLDTNIFVYSFDLTAPAKAARARELIEHALRSGLGMISYQVVQEFTHTALRKFPAPFTLQDAQSYLTTVLRPLLTVHSSPALFGAGLRLMESYSLSWYDALIVAAAQEAQCKALFSEDLQHGLRIDTLRIQNPFA